MMVYEHSGQELMLLSFPVLLTGIPGGNGRVTMNTTIRSKHMELIRECVLAPSESSRFNAIHEGERFDAIRLLGETVTNLRRGRRLLISHGGEFSLGGLTLQVGYSVPREGILYEETTVQMVSSLRLFEPPAPPRVAVQRKHAKPMRPLTDYEYSSSAEVLCTVCQTGLVQGCRVVTLACCKDYTAHMYHKECIEPWLSANRHCPVCKLEVD